MRAVAGLPSIIGWPSQRHHTPLTSTLAIIGMCLGLLGLSTFGMPSTAWATSGPSVNAVTPPSPYPNPGDQRSATGPSPGQPLIPAPYPPAPPSMSMTYNHVETAVAWAGVHPRFDPVTPQPSSAAAIGSDPGRPDRDLARSLIYSGALALVIAGSGLIMLGSRRRLW